MASFKGRICLGRENICKNCIKEDVCKIAEDFYKEPVYGMYIEGCDYFKDRNRFVELPCKAGDTVFVVNGFKEIEELEVDYYVVEKNVISVGMVDDGEYEVETVFLTREEAEQALKERGNGTT